MKKTMKTGKEELAEQKNSQTAEQKKQLAEDKKQQSIEEEKKSIRVFAPIQLLVQTTTDYSIFKEHPSQRDLDKNKTNKIIRSIKKIGYIPQVVIVNNKMQVMIGQHRIDAAKYYGYPVYYMIMSDLSLKQIVGLETSTKWDGSSKLQSCVNAGIPIALQINNLMEDWNNNWGGKYNTITVPQILSIVLKDSNLLSEINKIDLEEKLMTLPTLSASEIKYVNNVIDIFLYTMTNCAPKGIRKLNLQHALLNLIFKHDIFDFASFKNKLKNHKFPTRETVEEYKFLIVKCYNNKKKNKNEMIFV
jgi:hypothetical protein